MEGRVFENFQKYQKIFKNPKMPKFLPKSVQTCFEDVLGWLFRKFFLPSVPWRVESSKIFKKFKKVSKFQKIPKSFQKVSQRVLNKFRVDFFEKIFCPVFHGGSSLRKFSKKSKKFQYSKNARNRPQKCPNEIFHKQKKIKNPNLPKIVPKSVQSCFEDVLGWFFWKKFLPSVPWRVESSKIFRKIKKISKFQKCPKSFPKVSNCVLKMF